MTIDRQTDDGAYQDKTMNETGKISYVELPARDIEATKAFYSAAFGWNFVDYGPEQGTSEQPCAERVSVRKAADCVG